MRDGDFELVTLRSGARAVRHIGHGEIMHPGGGPWIESNRLYIEQSQLASRLRRPSGQPVCIFDVGLGAATNAVAALFCAREQGGAVEIHSFEIDLAPLRLALADGDGFPFLRPFHDAAQALVERGEWTDGQSRWILHRGDLLESLALAPRTAELVFFDPFSPQTNPLLWTPQFFAALRTHCVDEGNGDGALLMTYSAATPMRVSLLLGGFYVGAGVSIGNKRETTVAATKKAGLVEPLGARWLERWERSTARAPIGDLALQPDHEVALRSHPQFRAERDV
jgi:tRNA U34 5-methylaminomethyl-2-thiouridine-forming methyltransferase MnmC